MLKLADSVIYISEYDKRAWGMSDEPQAHVIPNWVDLSEFDFRLPQFPARTSWKITPNQRVILFMGGVSPLKGTLPLLQAFAELGDIPNLVLVVAGYAGAIAGEGSAGRHISPYENAIRNVLEQPQVGERVKFVGMVGDVAYLYAASDIVVFPATQAHQSRPLIEAGAMKKPVVISHFKQIDEFCRNEETCLTVPPGDPPSLGAALRRLIHDPDLREGLGRKNYELVHGRHNKDVSCEELLKIYETIN